MRTPAPMARSRYDVFISYSHAADGALAPALQHGLQSFAKPWWRRRSLRVFRDDTGLTANPDLWESIVGALEDSEWFLLLASPEAASSPWVDREVAWWRTHKNPARLLPVVTAGEFLWDPATRDIDSEKTTAAPPALHGAYADEPRWIDLRWAHAATDLDLRHPRFRAALADISAPVRGMPKEELESDELRQHRRMVRTAWAATSAIAILAVLGLLAATVAFLQRSDALQQERVARRAEESEQVQRLQAQATQLAASRIDRALLLALEAWLRSPSTSTIGSVMEVLGQAGAIEAVAPLRGAGGAATVSEDQLVWTLDADSIIGEAVVDGAPAVTLRTRPGERAYDLAVVGSGPIVVSYADGTVQALEPGTGEVLGQRTFEAAVDLDEFGDQVLAIEPGGQAIILDLPGLVTAVVTSTSDVDGASASADGSVLPGVNIGHCDGGVCFVGAFDGKVRSTTSKVGSVSLSAVVTALRVDASASKVFAGTVDGGIHTWSWDAPETVTTLARLEASRYSTSLELLPPGDALAVGLIDGTVYRLPLEPNAQLEPILAAGSGVTDLRVDERNDVLTAVTWTHSYRLRLDGRAAVAERLRTGSTVDAVAMVDDDIVLATDSGVVERLSPSSGAESATSDVCDDCGVPAMVSTADGIVVSTVSFPGVDVAELRRLQVAAGVDLATALGADFVAPLQESSLALLDEGGRAVWQRDVPFPVVSLTSLPDGSIVALDTTASVSVVDPSTGDELHVLRAVIPDDGWRASFTRGRLAISGARGISRIARYDSHSQRLSLDDRTFEGWVLDARDGAVMFVAARGIVVADAQTLDPVSTFATEDNTFEAVMLPQSSYVVVNAGAQIHVWRADTGQRLASFPYPNGYLNRAVALGPFTFLTLDTAGNLDRWRVDARSVVGAACSIIDRALTADEWRMYLPNEARRSTCAAALTR